MAIPAHWNRSGTIILLLLITAFSAAIIGLAVEEIVLGEKIDPYYEGASPSGSAAVAFGVIDIVFVFFLSICLAKTPVDGRGVSFCATLLSLAWLGLSIYEIYVWAKIGNLSLAFKEVCNPDYDNYYYGSSYGSSDGSSDGYSFGYSYGYSYDTREDACHILRVTFAWFILGIAAFLTLLILAIMAYRASSKKPAAEARAPPVLSQGQETTHISVAQAFPESAEKQYVPPQGHEGSYIPVSQAFPQSGPTQTV